MAASASTPLTLKARYVFPVAGHPIAGGSVTFRNGMIEAVGTALGDGEIRDLGNVAIVPGLVNAHTHLEFSDLTEPLGRPGLGFVDWIQEVIAYRRRRTEPVGRAVVQGLAECIRLGTTAVGEIAQPGWSAEPFRDAGLDATVFLELIALDADRVSEVMAAADSHLKAPGASADWRAGISPHAPYTVHASLMSAAVLLAARRRVPLAFHLAESKDEIQLAASGGGPLGEFLARVVGPEKARALGARTPEEWICELSPAPRVLLIHGNYLNDRAIALLADRADRMAVVYCPRTHAHFGHDPYPLAVMLQAGAAVAMGTDSRASSPDLSMLAEMRFAARRHPSVPLSTILRMGTLGGAAALGRADRIGSLRPAMRADLTVIRLPDRNADDPHALLFDSDEPVVATWIGGVERTTAL